MWTILMLVAFLVIWKLLGRRLLAGFVLNIAGQGALEDLGKKAVDAQPDGIRLSRVATPVWDDAGVQQIITSFRAAGFADAGVYSVDMMPGVKVAILVKPQDCVAAHVFEHPKTGTWIELVTRYQDGTSSALTTLPSTGQKQPPWLTTMRTAETPARDLVCQFMRDRRAGAMKAISAEQAPRDLEENFAKYMLWRRATPMTAAEIAPSVKAWAQKGTGQTANLV
ncbi:MAG TPA: hypothetical protein VMT05_02150 [Terriglobales bacterium]|jgi:hypothetical protein|nr:hypothetical protein [Terriglobales bacterium]